MFKDVAEGYPGLSAPEAVAYIEKYQVQADVWFASNEAATVRDVARGQRVLAIFNDLLDAGAGLTSSGMQQEITLDLDDIQGTVLRHRPPDYRGAYLLYRVDQVDDAKASLRRALPNVTSAAKWDTPVPFTLNIAFTWHGLRELGVSARELDAFPEEFRMGMAARKLVLGDTGASDPACWVAPLGTDRVHIGIIISSSSDAALREPLRAARAMPGLTCIYELARRSTTHRPRAFRLPRRDRHAAHHRQRSERMSWPGRHHAGRVLVRLSRRIRLGPADARLGPADPKRQLPRV